MIKIILFTYLIIQFCSNQQVQTIQLLPQHHLSKQPIDMAKILSQYQIQRVQKVVFHYLCQQIYKVKETLNNESINKKIISLFQQRYIKQLRIELGKFMRNRLFQQLDMQALSQNLKDQIQKSPQSYFLTYQMYNLLID